ncbi:Transcription initiation factor TFIID subunit 2 [Didymosphaeria variabile]|uniref:Transcription initiation factor TFIID subunit 2 n=1 Tax=Didymosphaeria variabile TaxID=1932322 RepID=A0A9W8XAZ4_9PLEO|nr:Transcription initiation factor TFIID subunit 2 [Didymosphaeria variabile]KAJ4345786.1 Transcription initiation factor TFIID subunit 2 [Didymosphaeria variabile]
MDEGVDDPALASAFTVESQRLEFDISFRPRLLKAKTQITIQPQSPKLKEIHLSCRQLKPTRVRLSSRNVHLEYHDQYDHLGLPPQHTIHQYHFLRNRVGRHEIGVEEELKVPLPPDFKIPTRRMQGSQEVVCDPLVVEIEYKLDDFRDGLHFVGTGEGDSRYPHVYTRNTGFPGFASSLFPCVDDGNTRIPFELSVRYPRTVADALGKGPASDSRPQTNGAQKADSVLDGYDEDNELTEEERALEMRAVCSGELTDTIVDPTDPTRTTSSFRIDPITGGGVLPQHVGITIGPFQEVDLSRFRTESEGDRLQDQAVRVHAFCLPGREDELSNSAMMIPKTLDSFVDCYQTYRLGKSYELVFVDDLPHDTAHTMALTICSSRLLYPESVWEPLEHTTRTLVHAVASQWIGVDVIAQEPRDHWIIAGASWFMTEYYLRDLFGRNDHRFRQKAAMDKLLRMDVRRPSLYELGRYIHLDPGAQEFMDLKALAVLSILHNRLVKTSGKNGVDRCLYRLLLNRAGGSLNNGAISTDAFLLLCEKVGHQKLDSFFKQWVYQAGYPIFECHPTFNKKRQTVNLTIRQSQSGLIHDEPLSSSAFMREAKERSRSFVPSSDFPAFVGPMTIRIHEADGTPYEHIIEINSSNVRAEIPYNTKYKRIKRNKLNKERQAQAQGGDATGEQDEVTIYSLGDLFLNSEEVEEWKIQDWSTEDEQKMENEAYEYIRVDADFEWLARISITDMPSYMFVSQLQQDKDVVAQAESIQYLARKQGHGIISSFLVKTLMDARYFHGIRTMAAEVLANQFHVDGPVELIGLYHLKKAFQKLFYVSNSDMTRPNDFTDRALYNVQCAIPRAIAKVKGRDGRTPAEVKQFLLDIIRHNDNRGNEYSDDFYLATLMRGLAECLADPILDDSSIDFMAQSVEVEFRKKAMGEIDRHKRLDEWIPSYNNVFTTTALDCDVRLMMNRLKPLKISEFLFYSQTGNAENVRLKAWECLVRLGAFCTKDNITKYLIHELYADPSPYFRTQLLRIMGLAIGQIAVGDAIILNDLRKREANDGLVLGNEDDEGQSRKDKQDRAKLDGALRALRISLGKNLAFKEALEEALKANGSSLQIVSELLDICDMFVDQINRMVVVLKYPRYWKVARLDPPRASKLRMHFSRGNIRTKMLRPPKPIPPAVVEEAAKPPPKIAIKFGIGKSTTEDQAPDGLPTSVKTSLTAQSRPASESAPGTPIRVTTPAASQDNRKLPVAEVQSSVTLTGTPDGSKASTPAPSQVQAPSPASTQAPDISTPMEGVEITSVPAKPRPQPPVKASTPAPAPSPAPATVPAPASAKPTPTPTPTPTAETPKPPKLKLKTKNPLKAPKPSSSLPKAKSKRIVLRLPPEKLATLGKRKAQTDIDPRPAKRTPTASPYLNGGTSTPTRKLVTVEKKTGERPRLLVKMKVGSANLARLVR